jgi:hypothetical protein
MAGLLAFRPQAHPKDYIILTITLIKRYHGVREMNEQQPTLDEWKDLYDAAIRFKELKCWDLMEDSDIFGVMNPEDGEIGYCCVTGMLGEHFALVVYQGTEGLEGCLRIQSGEYVPLIDAMHIQKCLMASFGNKKRLSREDRKIIKKLGLKFKRRSLWAQFRSHLPGYFPWRLTGYEARYLTLALQQTIGVYQRFESDSGLLIPPDDSDDSYLVRVPVGAGDDSRWVDEWLEPERLEREFTVEPVDEQRLIKVKRAARKSGDVWEIDMFHAPSAMQDDADERPYCPHIIVVTNHRSGEILHHHVAEPPEYRPELQEQVLDVIERMKSRPKEIMVRREEVFKLLEPITTGMEIDLELVEDLMVIDMIQQSMLEHFETQQMTR